jgi:hypothetical protein
VAGETRAAYLGVIGFAPSKKNEPAGINSGGPRRGDGSYSVTNGQILGVQQVDT